MTSSLKPLRIRNQIFQAAFQTSKLLLAASVGNYLVGILSWAVIAATFPIPFLILIAELLWINWRKRRKQAPVTKLGKSLVKFAGWIEEGIVAGEFFAVGYALIIAIPKVNNNAFVFLGIVGLVASFIIVALAVLAVRVVDNALELIESSSPQATQKVKRRRLTYRQWIRLMFYSILGVGVYYVASPLLFGTNVVVAALSLSATSLAVATLAMVLPELKSLPPQVDPTAEGQNWSEEK